MLSDTQIYELAKRMNVPLADVCFKDELQGKLQYNKGYIVNMENELDEDGTPSTGSH